MFQDQIAAAIEGTRDDNHLDDLSRLIWRGLAEGQITDEAAQGLAEKVHIRRVLSINTAPHRSPQAATGRPSIFPPRRPQRPPYRSQAIQRRRRVAASGFAPPAIASRFTTAEQAALAIVVDEHRRRGDCRLPIDAIAARAGCSRTSVQNALRAARATRLVRVTPRPRRGQKHLPNIVEIVSPEWRTWIRKRGNRQGVDRVQIFERHEKPIDSYRENRGYKTKNIVNTYSQIHDSFQKEEIDILRQEETVRWRPDYKA